MDVRELLQIPRNLSLYERVKFDEFECLNVNITVPKDAKPGSLPVVIWIHGGSQIVTFPAADERLGGILQHHPPTLDCVTDIARPWSISSSVCLQSEALYSGHLQPPSQYLRIRRQQRPQEPSAPGLFTAVCLGPKQHSRFRW